ncbi:MAG: Ribonuclease E inhibitor RraA [uncultured Thiotrichaceae bacterium]|uniref:4-hydroxy-4-methyl-2-oxoglutarate aldolase n=1 Tax=uncultured Thiotrichaceae bacterium TaxID=298394 RepID=A0A6S6U6P7_9GAMM|nr:MAG: Ribonuclease E inhibitor RraA [uncultured Thiotrichaceae bacterium]
MFKTADLCDEHYDNGYIQICHPIFSDFGGLDRFHGEIRTIHCFEDNSKVREAVAQDGKGCVLVIDAGASIRCAMLGDLLAAKAVKNGWAGVIMHGLIRDSADIAEMELGVKALGTLPLKSVKRGLGTLDIPVSFAGVTFNPGEYVYADEDGIIASPKALL